ncbi:MAG: hypothetical protein GF344_15820, partial [Chitinivibrionales bacterium]|nr:hypothetical protein [Chitinivibrionales bacterium]
MNKTYSRRKIITTAAAGIGGVAAARFFPLWGAQPDGAWKKGRQVNPMIDNLRVVNCTDPAMIVSNPKTWDIESQNAVVDVGKIRANVNAMACALAK